MQYNVAQLLKGSTGAERRYDVWEEIRDLDPDLEPLTPIVGSVTLMRTSQGILATGRLQVTLRLACNRCLESMTSEVELELEEEFHPLASFPESSLDQLPEEELDEALWIDEHHVLDLSEVIRQGLWLSAPMEAICRPDCAGLCPRCGGNRNLGECLCVGEEIDPRWAALQALLSEQSKLQERSD